MLEVVSKGNLNLNLDYRKGLEVYERNLQNLISICQKNKTEVVLSSYCFYLHDKVKNSKINQIYEKIVLQENEIIKKLAKKNNLPFVDCNSKIPKNIDYFVDTVHLTPKGMKFIANEISNYLTIN